MDLAKLTHPKVRQAIAALQAGDRTAWLSLFAPDATMTDDGSPRGFKSFSEEAVGHERFARIEKVENNGLDVYGAFHSERWGDFNTYFKFHPGPDGKFVRLDVGQAD